MVYNFHQVINRRGTHSVKWDACQQFFGRDDLLPMWVADADWPSPPEVREAFYQLIQHGIFGYTMPTEEDKDIVVDWVRRHYQWEIEPDWILFTPGIVPSLHMAVKAFTNPGDEVVVQSPVYYPFYSAITKQGAVVVNNQLQLVGDTYQMHLEDLKKKIHKKGGVIGSAARIRMLILCSPHNPVGRVWDQEELIQLGEICAEEGILVVSDEIHSDLILGEKRHHPYSKLFPDSITMISPSKTFNIPGLQIGVMIIPQKRIRSIFQNVCSGVLKSGNTFALEALRITYSKCDSWLREEIQVLRDNLSLALKELEHVPGLKAIKPQATYLLWIDGRELFPNPHELNHFFLDQAKVALVDGCWFGKGGEGFMRLNFACQRSILQEGLKRIKDGVKKIH